MDFTYTFLANFFCMLLLFTMAYDINNNYRQNWFHKTNTNRQNRQVFIFPDGDSQDFNKNNRGFIWGNNNNNNNNRRRFPTQNDIRPVAENLNDIFIFDQNDDNTKQIFSSTQKTPTSTVAVPGMATARSACEDRCLTTPEYNPICGDDGITYFSKARLRCAQKCGKRVNALHIGACPRTS